MSCVMRSPHPKGAEVKGEWLLTGESVINYCFTQLFPLLVNLKKIQECCNCVDNLQAYIVFFMRDIHELYCIVRFSDGHRG